MSRRKYKIKNIDNSKLLIMKDKELIRKMYYFAIKLAHDLEKDKFTSHRETWNELMEECEIKLDMK